MKRKLALFTLVLTAFLSGCSFSDNETSSENVSIDYANIEKPEKIRLLASTIVDPGDEFEQLIAAYKADTGITLEVIRPDHNVYYERVNVAVAGSNLYDVMEVGGAYYPTYSSYGLLYDMTDVYEASPQNNADTNKYADALRFNGRLYGFPMMKGNGTITHIRKDWLDRFSLSAPKNYAEFINMLEKFKTITYYDEETAEEKNMIPITAAGVINSEYPYNIYLPEFYQGANPDFYYDESSGKYVDGMLQPNMKDALARFKFAWEDGLLDEDIFTNKTSTCRDKLYSGKVGTFNYWAGSWTYLMSETVKEEVDGELIAVEPIAECKYIERSPLALVIPKFAENPEGIYKYFIDYTHDGGKGQLLFTRGVENQSWKIENGKGTLINAKPGSIAKLYYTPDLCFRDFGDPITFDPTVINSTKILEENSVLYPIPVATDTATDMLPEIDAVRRNVFEKVIKGEMTVDEGIDYYKEQMSEISDTVLSELNDGGDKNE
ncbi:MAG: extracellular solute-binding protein [Firmicutes bacterium]|nr:extracellular solute-binding protein [Bacillota bacterium]